MLRSALIILFMLLLGSAAYSCGQGPDLQGRYEAVNPQHQGNVVVLALRSAGKGSWTIEGEEVPIRWERRNQEIWLHHKGGAVIAGKLVEAGRIDVELPGLGRFLFLRKQ